MYDTYIYIHIYIYIYVDFLVDIGFNGFVGPESLKDRGLNWEQQTTPGLEGFESRAAQRPSARRGPRRRSIIQ